MQGYCPFINFSVKDMETMIPRLIQLGGALDGPVRYPLYGKVGPVHEPMSGLLTTE